jgi:AcrR family transcriptional regulator
MGTRRLTRRDWEFAALRAVARGGIAAISIEALARELGATRGSFYWHFTSRYALIEAALAYWRREATDAVIAEVGAEPDPRRRLRRILEYAVTIDPIIGLEPALTAQADHPAVTPVLRQVTSARIAFLSDCYVDLGLSPDMARRQALIAYAAYLGWLDLRQIGGEDLPEAETEGRPARVALDQLIDTLLPD